MSDSQPPEDTLLLERPAEGVAVLRLNRPQATNALSLELQQQLNRRFTELADDDSVRCIILTGGDKVFAAGGDITGLIDADPIEIYKRHTERVWAPIQNCPKPVVAAISGYAFGGGCELAMHADILIAGESASFCQPEIRIGIMPGIGGTQRLVRAIGKAKAMSMALTGRPISAHEAWVAGLVSEVCADDEVMDTALKTARTIARMPPLAAEQIKECILHGMDASLESALSLERKANAMLFASRDQQEGMQAFLDKRHPQFTGE
ncbi:enoyl-CoA hydratase/isomerase family protein [Marinobacterium sp. AK62]|uniref:Enoyl-CoA hydratase/isomerase family protein n=1 Tax=Marinobacterium alkalitolerans TaxID=1542925 RepID=A0ABS3Z6X4_9GAMM|nr:enoyl-CoA hydratase [Marinobacterium alkalitolerans]MBP0047464.1 enoyl-CoA hydratase/isomerase family protein [Marinobacterium alkalitolerans]